MQKHLKPHRCKLVTCTQPLPIPVQEGLAYSPGQMKALQEKGIPISSQTIDSDFYDGDTNGVLYVEPARIRGYSIIDAWNDEKTAKSNLIRAHLSDKATFEDIK